MADSNDRREQRIAKLETLRQQGIEPYPPRVERTHTAAEALAAFQDAPSPQDPSEGVRVIVAGRLISIRVMGRSTFAHVADGTGQIQIGRASGRERV